MTGLHKRLPQSRHGWVVAAYLVVALTLGGGGSPSAAAEILVQTGFLACVLAWFFWAGEAQAPARPTIWLAAAIVALPLVQLVPLPPAIWQTLPGRGMVLASLDLVQAGNSWQPLSVAPAITFAGLLAVVPVAGTMLAVATLHHHDRRAIMLVIGLVALAGAALGVLQMAGGPGSFRLYQVSHDLWLTAFHASRNSAADALLIGSLAMTAWVASASGRRPTFKRDLALLAIVQSLLLLALVLTGSRAGIGLLAPVLLFQFAMLRSAGIARQVTNSLAALAALIAVIVGGAVLLSGNSRIGAALDRFDASQDFRSELWLDTVTAIGAFFPFGSGIGTFPRAFIPFERAEVLDDLWPNRAHNDYLEFLLEAGLLAPLALALFAALIFAMVRKAWRERPGERVTLLFALGILMVIGLHSIVDYPLRNMALASIAGVAVGLLGALSRAPEAHRKLDAQE